MQLKIIRLVTTNDRGMRIGQSHQRAKLTDAEVDRIRDLHEDQGVGYQRLAEQFKVSKRTIRDICAYRTRAQAPAGFKRVVEVREELEEVGQ